MSIENISLGLFWLCLYMAPLAIISGSKLSRANEKTGWLLLTIVFSWIALVCYYSTVLSHKERKKRHETKMENLRKQELAKQQERIRQARVEALQAQNGTGADTEELQQDAPVEPLDPGIVQPDLPQDENQDRH